MKKGISIAIVLALAGVQVVLTSGRMKTTGAHESSTGAPGEQTCAQSSCHTDASVNNGATVNTLTFGNNETAYELGKKYTVTINVKKAGISKFGFQVVPLDKANKYIGTLGIINSTRTKGQSGSGSVADRKYVTHKSAGTPAIAPGENEWDFYWTAPSTDKGPVTFYYTTNCTNNNNQNTGDALYLSSSKIESPLSSSIIENTALNAWNVYWRAFKGQIILDYDLRNSANVELSLYDLQGKLIIQRTLTATNAGQHHENIDLGTATNSGIYIVNFVVDGKPLSKKIFIY